MPEEIIYEKECPDCKAINYSTECEDTRTAVARIWFTCKKCSLRYYNWYYGGSSKYGEQPFGKDLVRKPFKVICIVEDKGITVSNVYEAFDSLEDENAFIILKNDKNKEASYHKDNFISDRKKK